MSGPLAAIAVLLIVLPILPITAAVVLGRHYMSDSMALRERTGLAFRDAAVASIAALAAANRIFNWNLPGEAIGLALGVALTLISLPSAIWLVLYFRGRFS